MDGETPSPLSSSPGTSDFELVDQPNINEDIEQASEETSGQIDAATEGAGAALTDVIGAVGDAVQDTADSVVDSANSAVKSAAESGPSISKLTSTIKDTVAGVGPASPSKTSITTAKTTAPIMSTAPAGRESWLKAKFPPQVRELVYYNNPIKSAIAIGAIALGLMLLVCDCGFSLLWLFSMTGKWILAATAAISLLFALYQSVRPSPDMQNPLTQYVKPRVDMAVAHVEKYCPSRQTIYHAVDAVMDKSGQAQAVAGDVFYCRDLTTTLKAVVALFCLQMVGALFSFWTLVVLGLIILFSIPVAYEYNQAPVDKVVSQAVEHSQQLIQRGMAAIPGRAKKD